MPSNGLLMMILCSFGHFEWNMSSFRLDQSSTTRREEENELPRTWANCNEKTATIEQNACACTKVKRNRLLFLNEI